MNKKLSLLLCAATVLLFASSQSIAQDTCGLQSPLTVSEIKGRVLFDYYGKVFAVKDAVIGLSVKGNLAFQVVAQASTDTNGRFELKGIRPGKYYLSISAERLAPINLMEINVISGSGSNVVDNEIEFAVGAEEGKECGGGYVKVVKQHNDQPVSGRSLSDVTEQITEISLERTGCFGICPIYKVVFRRDGTATYIGKDFVSRKGTYHGKIEYGFNQLAELVYRSGFFNLNNKYAAPYTDLDTAIIGVVRSGKKKAVENYGGEAPIEVWGIEKAIDALVEDIKWEAPRATPKNRRAPCPTQRRI